MRSGELIASRLRVMTWNVWWRYGPWEERSPAIEKTLREVDADLIALQEVWGEGENNFAAELGAKLGLEHAYEARKIRKGIGFGNAVLSRWPIVRTAVRHLPALADADEQRLVMMAEVDGPRGPLQLFCTHLNYRLGHSHVRQRQNAAIARFVADNVRSAFPPIVCGDFNAAPDTDEMRMLAGQTTCPVDGLVFRDAWRDAGDGGPGLTWDKVNPFAAAELETDQRIDYVLVGQPGERGAGHVVSCEVRGNEPVDGVWPSDHLAVVAELRY